MLPWIWLSQVIQNSGNGTYNKKNAEYCHAIIAMPRLQLYLCSRVIIGFRINSSQQLHMRGIPPNTSQFIQTGPAAKFLRFLSIQNEVNFWSW